MGGSWRPVPATPVGGSPATAPGRRQACEKRYRCSRCAAAAAHAGSLRDLRGVQSASGTPDAAPAAPRDAVDRSMAGCPQPAPHAARDQPHPKLAPGIPSAPAPELAPGGSHAGTGARAPGRIRSAGTEAAGHDLAGGTGAAGCHPGAGIRTADHHASARRHPGKRSPTRRPLAQAAQRHGIYLSAWSAAGRLPEFLEFLQQHGLNSFVVDLKDDSGYLTYDSELALASRAGSRTWSHQAGRAGSGGARSGHLRHRADGGVQGPVPVPLAGSPAGGMGPGTGRSLALSRPGGAAAEPASTAGGRRHYGHRRYGQGYRPRPGACYRAARVLGRSLRGRGLEIQRCGGRRDSGTRGGRNSVRLHSLPLQTVRSSAPGTATGAPV